MKKLFFDIETIPAEKEKEEDAPGYI